MSIQKQSARNGEYRCERCWSESDINLYPISDFLGKDAKGLLILCKRCKSEVPKDKDPKVFEYLFLRFASTKEFVQHYNATSEQEAKKFWESEVQGEKSLSAKITNNTEFQLEKKGIIDQRPPFGYEDVDGKLTLVNRDAKVVKGIFESYLSGKTMEKIARDLKREDGNRSIKWSLNEVRDILKDPIYAGYEYKGSDVVLANHEKIVDKDTFNRVQKRIVRNIRNPRYLYEPLVLGE
jgi:hypothetical protein